MTELQRLLHTYDAHYAAGRTCALATVVDVAGRACARLLVTADGQLTGSISGGCLKGDAHRCAQQTGKTNAHHLRPDQRRPAL